MHKVKRAPNYLNDTKTTCKCWISSFSMINQLDFNQTTARFHLSSTPKGRVTNYLSLKGSFVTK